MRLLLALSLALVVGSPSSTVQSQSNVDRRVQELERRVTQLEAELRELRGSRNGADERSAVSAVSALIPIAGWPAKGRVDAPLVLIEYSDFHCPFCRRHSRSTLPAIDSAYVATGKVQYVFANLPLEGLHPEAGALALAAVCAERQGRFWPFHDRLFAAPTRVSPSMLPREAQAVGMDLAAFKRCRNEAATSNTVQQTIRTAAELKIESTPSFLIGTRDSAGRVRVTTRIRGAQPFDVFQRVFDERMAAPLR